VSAETDIRPRRAWVALLLGLFAPVVGFAYVGRLALGFAVFFAGPAAMFALGWSGLVQNLPVFYTFAAFLILLQLWIFFYLWRRARASADYRLHAYNRWYVYIGLLLVSFVLSNVLATQRGRLFGFDVYRIPAVSMSPTLAPGDFVLADMRPTAIGRPGRGDIVVYRPHRDGHPPWIGRLVGLPGEIILAGERAVEIDGKRLDEPYLHAQREPMGLPIPYASQTLGADEYFILGDNRARSDDSRFQGPYRRERLVGRVSAIWFSRDLGRIGALDRDTTQFSKGSNQ
jgi:signal peptidase I